MAHPNKHKKPKGKQPIAPPTPETPVRQRKLLPEWLERRCSWKWLFFVLSGVILLTLLFTAPKVPNNPDESLQIVHGQSTLNYFIDGDTSFTHYDKNSLLEDIQWKDQRYYGVGFEIIPAIAMRYFGLWEHLFEFRHILCALFAFAMMFFVGLIGKELKNWQLGIICLLVIALTPNIFGLSMHEGKDIPPATGFAIAIYGFVCIFKRLPQMRRRDFFFAFLGIAVATSSRINGLMLPFYFAAGALALLAFNAALRKQMFANVRLFFKIAGISAGVCVAGALVGLCFYPDFYYQGPVNLVKNALDVMAHHTVGINFMWKGSMVNSHRLPSGYLFQAYWYTLPPFVFAGMLLCLCNIKRIVKSYSGFLLLFLLFTVVFPIAYILLANSPLYGLWRHTTFVYPSFVPFVAIGIYETSHWAHKGWSGKIYRWGYAALVVACIYPTASWVKRNYPYAYVYYNSFAGDTWGRFPVDYYVLSEVNCMKWLIENKILADTTRTYTILTKAQACWPLIKTAYPQLVSKIKIVQTSMRGFAASSGDYAIMDAEYLPTNVLKTFFPKHRPNRGTIHEEKIEGNTICAVIEKNPDDAEGIHLIQQNRFAEGMEKLEKAYAYNPNNFGLWYWMGLGYYYTQQYEKAIEFLSKTISLWPTGEEIVYGYAHIGAAQVELKKYDLAIANLQNALQRLNNSTRQMEPFINANLGIACYNQKKYKEAVGYLEKCVAQYPHLQGALQYCRMQAQ